MAARTLSTPVPVSGGSTEDLNFAQPVARQDALEGFQHRPDVVLWEPVNLVEHNDRYGSVRGQRRQEVVVHGGVGVFLRIEDPDEDVHEPHHPLHNLPVGRPGRVEVGQVQKDQPGAVVGEPLHRGSSMALPDLQPVQQRIAALGRPRCPPAAPMVVGRRTAAVAISSPLTALKSDDLPLPVAPKNPTTV